jgi:hypothetical protein
MRIDLKFRPENRGEKHPRQQTRKKRESHCTTSIFPSM